jgi:hypothetical protein
MDAPHSIYPLPEVLPGERGNGWRIRDGRRGRGVDFKERVIRVPLDGSDTSHCARMQEIGRIKWDDPAVRMTKDLETSLLFQAVEGHRVNFLLRRSGIDISAGPFNADQLEILHSLRGPAGTLASMLLTDYTDHAPRPEDLLGRSQGVRLFSEVKRRIQESPTKPTALSVLGWLRGLVRDVEMVPSPNARPLFCLLAGGCPGVPMQDGTFDDFFDMGWDELEEDIRLHEVPAAVRAQLPTELTGRLADAAKGQMGKKATFVPWGSLGLENPPRNQAVLGRFMKKWKATEEGVFARYSHRYFVDGRVFARRHKVPGGTVVIDASGSMSLSSAQIQAMVECAPGCVVACYSGTGKGGVLRILAAGGKRVDNKYCAPPNGCGNIVDFPALRWAYKQSHPRIWVSDLGVTGVNDQPGQGNLAMCSAAVKKGRFFNALNTEEALKVLRRLGRFYRKG